MLWHAARGGSFRCRPRRRRRSRKRVCGVSGVVVVGVVVDFGQRVRLFIVAVHGHRLAAREVGGNELLRRRGLEGSAGRFEGEVTPEVLDGTCEFSLLEKLWRTNKRRAHRLTEGTVTWCMVSSRTPVSPTRGPCVARRISTSEQIDPFFSGSTCGVSNQKYRLCSLC